MGEPVAEACDIYAIGVILSELVTGRRPFDAELVSTRRAAARMAGTRAPARPPSGETVVK